MKEKEIDTRMVLCVMGGYSTCAAKVPKACICYQMPSIMYRKELLTKYGSRRAEAKAFDQALIRLGLD